MNNMFKRLTLIYWLVFLAAYCAFILNFFGRYEKIYHQTLDEVKVETRIDTEVLELEIKNFDRRIMQHKNELEILYEQLYQSNELLDENNLNEVLLDLGASDFSALTKNEKIELSVLMQIRQVQTKLLGDKTYKSMFSITETKTKIKDVFYFSYSDNKKIYQSLIDDGKEPLNEFYQEHKNDLIPSGYNTRRDSIKVTFYYDDKTEKMYSFIKVDVKTDEKLHGFMLYVIDLCKETLVLGPEGENYLMHLSETRKLPIDSSVKELFATYPVEEAIEKLEQGDHIVHLVDRESNLPKLIYYFRKPMFERYVFFETLNVFEFNLLLFSTIFLAVSYMVFAAIIKPAYLLTDYVKQCSKGNYDIPKPMSSSWRSIFITVRDAYLENEQLLVVKEKQSQELEYAWKRALVANQAKTQFLAKVSHELRTPLNAIKGYIQLLKLNLTEPKHVRQLDIIDTSSNLLLNVVNELLDFSRIEEGKVHIEYQLVDMNKIGYLMKDMFINQIKEKDVEYQITIDPRIPKVLYGDENKIKQILINLISNAVKFTNQGYINVLAYLERIDEEYAYIMFKVEDTGVGIEVDKLDTIFDSFAQENNSISRKYGGTGLGLSIVKGLVEAMGGTVTVESEKYVRSTFTVRVPLHIRPVEDE